MKTWLNRFFKMTITKWDGILNRGRPGDLVAPRLGLRVCMTVSETQWQDIPMSTCPIADIMYSSRIGRKKNQMIAKSIAVLLFILGSGNRKDYTGRQDDPNTNQTTTIKGIISSEVWIGRFTLSRL